MRTLRGRRIKFLAVLAMAAMAVSGVVIVFEQAQKTSIHTQGVQDVAGGGDQQLLARLIFGEAANEPLEGQVAVAAVILNRVKDPKFPNSLAGVVYEPLAFESVSNGQIWVENPNTTQYDAAQMAMNGWDPTYGCTFFWNPGKPVSPWVWSRSLVTQIGNHVFAR